MSAKGRAEQFIRSQPEESMALALAAGAVVGVALGVALAEQSRARSARSGRFAQGLGERLLSSLDKALPDSVSKSLGTK